MSMTATAPPAGEVGDLPTTYKPEPLAATLDRVVAFNRRFVHHADDSTHDLIALWVAHTYGMPVWDWTGRLYITAPQPGCGKSTQADVMALLSADALPASSVSGPGLFRAISAGPPTVFLDEAENQFSAYGGRDTEIVTAVVNGGYKRGAFVVRSESNVPVRHSTFAPLCIIGVDNGRLPDTTRSRCIPVRMTPGADCERFRSRAHKDFAAEVATRFADAAIDWQIAECGTMRQADLWEALYSVANAAGGDWPKRCAVAAERHVWDRKPSTSGLTLATVRDWFREHDRDRVTSSVLADYLSANDELPRITPKALAPIMAGYRVYPTKSNGSMTYWRRDLAPVFARWLD
jgi:hypothetical protein